MNSNTSKISCKRGFTLIELLVVVLIIGILAAVAVPQYQKAVQKARLSEVASTFNAISKGVEVYLLENGYPTEDMVSFVGTEKTAELDISIPCTRENEGRCYTKVGAWWAYCESSGCNIGFSAAITVDGTEDDNPWLDAAPYWSKSSGEDSWTLNVGDASSSAQAVICSWWQGHADSSCSGYR